MPPRRKTQTHDQLDIVERAYDQLGGSAGSDAWFGAVATALGGSIDGAIGSFAFEVRSVDGRPQLGRQWVEYPEITDKLQRSFVEMPPQVLALSFAQPLIAATGRAYYDQAGVPYPEDSLGAILAELDAVDLFTLGCYDPNGNGVTVGVLLGRTPSMAAGQAAWSRVAAHIAAGARLRERLHGDQPIEHAAAVVDLDGKLAHLVGEPPTERIEHLCQAVRIIEGVRNRRHDPQQGLELWQALIDGEWTLTDHFESDGRCYRVAVRNPPTGVRHLALTRREREVVAYIATGVSTKDTAYALGLGWSSIRCIVRDAMKKLGVKSRLDLIKLRTTLVEQDSAHGSEGSA